MMTKTYLIKTFGCAMNTADSEQVAGMLEGIGFEEVKSLDERPDLFVINTCSVRQSAEDKVYGLANKVLLLKEKSPGAKVAVIGCLVGSIRGKRKRLNEPQIRKKIPWADYLFSHDEIQTLPEILILDNSSTDWSSKALNTKSKRAQGKHAFVNISTGCDNFCTFCVVPYARGEEKSRTLNNILTEINNLVGQGCEEITLLGQNVNSWGIADRQQKHNIRTNSDEKLPFAHLLRTIHDIDEINKISFLSSNPFDFTSDLVETLSLPKISRYLHLAVQSGDDEILQRMNRRHTCGDFLTLLDNIRHTVPDIEIGTDIIVGFPGETEEQFQNTVEICKRAQFSVAYISLYSPRPGTNAAKFFKDDVPRNVKKKRHAILSKIIKKSKPNYTFIPVNKPGSI